MSNITAAEVNKLRKATGAGMMDCKKALVEANGNFESAIENWYNGVLTEETVKEYRLE